MSASSSGVVSALAIWLLGSPPGLPTAILPDGERVLLGTQRGLYREAASGWELVLTRRGVRGLARTAHSTLIATAGGLYEWGENGDEPRAVPLGAGARVHAVAVDAQGRAWVASEVGLFQRDAQAQVFTREGTLPAGAVQAVRAVGERVWVATRGMLWEGAPEGGFEPRLRSLETGWWELNGAVATPQGVVLSVPGGLWWLAENGAEPRQIELGAGEVRGLAWARDRLWVASKRGVLGVTPAALSEGSRDLVLDAEAYALAAGGRGLFVATRRGVALLPATAPQASALGFVAPRPSASEVQAVHRAVLAYLELSPRHIAHVETRARRAALYPQLRAGFSLDRGRSQDRSHDQSFTSGDTRSLFDYGRSDDLGGALDVQLVWELGKVAEPDQAISISRERRELIELRDQVLDRVNRLYFERLRVLARLATLAPEQNAERLEAELRARELTAHLDAWTGGLFSRLEKRPPPE